MKRHEFEMLSAAIRAARADIEAKEPDDCQRDMLDGVSYAAEFIADALARGSAPGGNRAFDRERFLRDCGVPLTVNGRPLCPRHALLTGDAS